MTAVIKDARPPNAVVRVLNPVLRTLLRSPVGRLIGPLALIEFTGRHSNKTYRVVVAWHDHLDTPIVLTPAPWRANFTNGAAVTVRWRGRRTNHFAVLDTDPDNVAAAMNILLTLMTVSAVWSAWSLLRAVWSIFLPRSAWKWDRGAEKIGRAHV